MSEGAAGGTGGVEARGLVRSFRRDGRELRVLDGAELSIAPGEVVALFGESGSGKSTLLSILGGLDDGFAGSVRLSGVELSGLAEPERSRLRARTVGFVFQDHNLLPRLTVSENLLLPFAFRRGERPGPEAASEALESVGIAPLARERAARLSGGERQRAAVARALVTRPRLLLCDEPTGSLDGANGRRVAELLVSLARGRGVAVLVASHDPSLWRGADRALELSGGRLQARLAGAA